MSDALERARRAIVDTDRLRRRETARDLERRTRHLVAELRAADAAARARFEVLAGELRLIVADLAALQREI